MRPIEISSGRCWRSEAPESTDPQVFWSNPVESYDALMEPPTGTPGRPVTDAVLERVVEQASELLRAQRVGLAVIEPDVDVNAGPILRFVAARGLSAQFPHVMRP